MRSLRPAVVALLVSTAGAVPAAPATSTVTVGVGWQQGEVRAWELVDSRTARSVAAGNLRGLTGFVRVRREALIDQVRPGDRLALPLADDVVLVATAQTVTDHPLNGYVWSGRVASEPWSMVTLVLEPEGLAGTLVFSRGAYEIRLLGDGLSAILDSPAVQQRHDDGPRPPFRLPANEPASRTRPPRSTIDVLGLFTPAALQEMGGKAAIVAAFKVAMANMNTAATNSKTRSLARLVKVAKVRYSQDGTAGADTIQALNDLSDPDDGQMDKAHRLRDRVGADLVSLALPRQDDYCGYGWTNGDGVGVTPADGVWAQNVVAANCLAGGAGLTFAHENGHNMGFNHNPEDVPDRTFIGGYKMFSWGYRVPGSFRTVMAYGCEPDGLPGCPQVPYYSQPRAKYDGQRTGNGMANNAKSLLKDRRVIADWRPCKRVC